MNKEMKIMDKLVQFLEKYLGPIAGRIESQRHIQSIKNGMMALITVLMVGSLSLIISAIGGLFPKGSAIKNFFENNAQVLNLPFTFTFGLLALYCAITISYNHAKKLEIPIAHGVVGGVLVTLILDVKIIDGAMNIEYLDSRGMFVAIIGSLIAVEIMAFFIKKKITLRFEGLPEMISQTFEAIVPLATIIVIAVIISVTVQNLTGGAIVPEAITKLIAPSINGVDTVWAVMLISFTEMLFWFVGLNGFAILVGFVMPFMTQYLAENAAAYQAGTAIPHVFTPSFWDFFLAATGSGITGALVILSIMSKRKDLNAIGKAAALPAMFSISEPVVFGLPIAYNPYLFIPFVFGTPLVGGFSFMVLKSGLVRAPIAQVGGIPVPLAQYLVTMDFRAVILFFVILGLGVLMYYPFFKMYEKSLENQDNDKDSRQKEFDALDLDF
ncbi:PTS system cellobiose-specific IIC component [Eubacterium multiforme]|uniref:Permease IIC component n=1 Tax=Eubacterium multiforme TaxID=83339 RepID=A0ABT9UXN2_9FIRM|nr:PTS transporter subunit EIIC [Eubacterium multiforme]MDQ0151080.1 PTS system cellobiose-specific IIC component [Eubacterium multiforme]